MNHQLKTDPATFTATQAGTKTAEIRYNDRNFNVGDTLTLCETRYSSEQMKKGSPLEFTGRAILVTVTHLLVGYGLMDGWVILSHTKPTITHH